MVSRIAGGRTARTCETERLGNTTHDQLPGRSPGAAVRGFPYDRAHQRHQSPDTPVIPALENHLGRHGPAVQPVVDRRARVLPVVFVHPPDAPAGFPKLELFLPCQGLVAVAAAHVCEDSAEPDHPIPVSDVQEEPPVDRHPGVRVEGLGQAVAHGPTEHARCIRDLALLDVQVSHHAGCVLRIRLATMQDPGKVREDRASVVHPGCDTAHDSHVGLRLQLLDFEFQALGNRDIVLFLHRDVFARRGSNKAVHGLREADVRCIAVDRDAVVAGGGGVAHRQRIVCAAVVDDVEAPVLEGLVLYGPNGLSNPLRTVVDGQDDAHARNAGRHRSLLRLTSPAASPSRKRSARIASGQDKSPRPFSCRGSGAW